MEIKPIRSKADYRAALKHIESLMDAKANTVAGDRLDVLVTLIEAYEKKHFPLDLPDPVGPEMSIKPWGRFTALRTSSRFRGVRLIWSSGMNPCSRSRIRITTFSPLYDGKVETRKSI